MATNVTFNGSSYSIPAQGDSQWGTNVSNYLIAIAAGALQKSGGSFTLTADVDFGTNFGLRSIKYAGRSTPATTGLFRAGNNQSIAWRDAANSADLELKVNSSDLLEFDGNPLVTLALGTAHYVLRMNSGATAYEWGLVTSNSIDGTVATASSVTTVAGNLSTHEANTSNPHSVTKTQVGLGNVDNTSDSTKNAASVTLTNKTITAPIISNYIDFNEGSAPSTPASTRSRLYVKSDGKFYWKDDAGTEYGVADTASAFVNPMTTQGDIVYGGASGTATRLAIGTLGKPLVAGSTTPVYSWGTVKTIASGDYTTNNYTITDSDGFNTFVAQTGATNRTITLPVAANNIGRPLRISKSSTGNGTLSLVMNGSDTIVGLTTATLYRPNGHMVLMAVDTNLYIFLEEPVDIFSPTLTATLVSNLDGNPSLVAATLVRRGRTVNVYSTWSVDITSSNVQTVFSIAGAGLVIPPSTYNSVGGSGGHDSSSGAEFNVAYGGVTSSVVYVDSPGPASGAANDWGVNFSYLCAY